MAKTIFGNRLTDVIREVKRGMKQKSAGAGSKNKAGGETGDEGAEMGQFYAFILGDFNRFLWGDNSPAAAAHALIQRLEFSQIVRYANQYVLSVRLRLIEELLNGAIGKNVLLSITDRQIFFNELQKQGLQVICQHLVIHPDATNEIARKYCAVVEGSSTVCTGLANWYECRHKLLNKYGPISYNAELGLEELRKPALPLSQAMKKSLDALLEVMDNHPLIP